MAPGGGSQRDNDTQDTAALRRVSSSTRPLCFSRQPINQCVTMATRPDAVMGGSMRSRVYAVANQPIPAANCYRQASINFDSVDTSLKAGVRNRAPSLICPAHLHSALGLCNAYSRGTDEVFQLIFSPSYCSCSMIGYRHHTVFSPSVRLSVSNAMHCGAQGRRKGLTVVPSSS